MVSAGERSGDMHAAHVVTALQKLEPNAVFRGMGGGDLQQAGVELVIDYRSGGGVMGLFELWGSLGKVFRSLRAMKRLLREWRPDLLIVVDYPDFNLRLARYAKRIGVPVLYFIPPKVWAWREHRIHALKKSADRIASILPFEPEFYRARGVQNIEFVGNPLCESSALPFDRVAAASRCGVDPERPVVALFPGSRRSEIQYHLDPMVEAFKLLREKHPQIQGILCIASSVDSAEIMSRVGGTVGISLTSGPGLDVMRLSDAGLIKCGTSTLEAAFSGLPSVVFFKASALSAFVMRRLLKISQFSLPNLIRPDTQPEILQEEATAERLAAELERQLFDARVRKDSKNALAEVRKRCEHTGAQGSVVEAATGTSTRVALMAQQLLHTRRESAPQTARKLYSFLAPYRGQFLLGLLLMVLFGATDGVVPLLIKNVLDGVFARHDKEWLYLLPGIVIAFAFLRAGLDYGQQYVMSRVGHSVVRDIRDRLNRHLLTLSGEFYLRHSVGNLLARFTSDTLLIRGLLMDGLSAILRDTVRIVALIVTAVYLDPVLACFALLVFPVAVFPIVKFGKKLRRLGREGQDAIGAISSQLQEVMLGNRVVKIFGREEHEAGRFAAENSRLTRTMLRSEHVRALTGPINEVLASAAVAGVILYGGLTVMNGVRSQGEFLAFLVSMFLLYDPLKKLSRVNAVVQQGLAGGERVLELLDEKPTVTEPDNAQPMRGDNSIELHQVSFRYSPDKPDALSSVSMRVPQGATVALVGLSGSGKSTLVDLIPRFIDPNVGAVTIGGVDLRTVSLGELRSKIALVSQHTFLFNDTVFNNIAYGASHDPASVDAAAVEAAARAAFAYDFIVRLPNGFATKIGEAGLSLSGGERQRIAIARALLKNAPILLLDEATASLDNQSEREVQLALEELQRGRTTIVIAHRLSTVRRADKIYVMREGALVEEGTHEDLLRRGGEYARLYQMQFHGKEEQNSTSVHAE